MVICRMATRDDIDTFKKLYNSFCALGIDELPNVTDAYADSETNKTVRHGRITEEQYEKMYNEMIDNEAIILAQKVDSKNVIGYAICNAFDDGVCEIDEIFIIPEFRNNEYCKECIKYICSQAKSIGMEKITVFSPTKETDDFWTKMQFNSEFDEKCDRPCYGAHYLLKLDEECPYLTMK